MNELSDVQRALACLAHRAASRSLMRPLRPANRWPRARRAGTAWSGGSCGRRRMPAAPARGRRCSRPRPIARPCSQRPVSACQAASICVGGHLVGIHARQAADIRQQALARALADELRAAVRQRHIGQRLTSRPRSASQIGEQLRVAHRFAVPAQRARLAGLVVEDGVTASFDGIDAIDAQLELSAGDADLAARFERFDGERRARALRDRAVSR